MSPLHMFVPLVCVFYSFCNDGSVKWEMHLNCSIHKFSNLLYRFHEWAIDQNWSVCQ